MSSRGDCKGVNRDRFGQQECYAMLCFAIDC